MDKIERINVWYDNAGHYLEVLWISKAGNYYMPTSNERVDVLVDDERNLSGFMVWGVTRAKEGEIVNLELKPVESEPIPALTATHPVHARRADQSETEVEINNISIRTEKAGEYFEVHWSKKSGAEYAPTADERVKVLTDSAGNVLGFKISGISLMGEGEKDFINVDIYPTNPLS